MRKGETRFTRIKYEEESTIFRGLRDLWRICKQPKRLKFHRATSDAERMENFYIFNCN